MFDGPLMMRVNSPVVDTIHLKGNKFVMGVKMHLRGGAVASWLVCLTLDQTV